MAKEELKDINGKESSKRKTGILLVKYALWMAGIYFVISLAWALLGKDLTFVFPFDIWLTIIGLGASLLGVTLIERFGKK